jgi:uncharacterized protein YbbC (DUF1343 family)
MFDKVVGSDQIRKSLLASASISEMERSWLPEVEKFKSKRKEYLLYQ